MLLCRLSRSQQDGRHFKMAIAYYSSLIKDKAYINGKWVGAKDGKTFNGKFVIFKKNKPIL